MSAATVLTSEMSGMPALSGTGGSLAALIRHIAPILGWSIEFDNSTDVIVIRPQSYGGGQALFYRIDDRAARGGAAPMVAEVRAYESMSDIDTGAGLIGTAYIHKSYYASTAAQKYYVVGDAYGFYLGTNPYRSIAYYDGAYLCQYLGFLNRFFDDDTPICGLLGNRDGTVNGATALTWLVCQEPTGASSAYAYLHKNRSGVTGISPALVKNSSHQIAGRALASNEDTYLFNSAYTGRVFYSRPFLNDGAANTIGCFLPGLYGLHQAYAGVGVPDITSAPASIVPAEIDDKKFVRFTSFTCSSGDQYSAYNTVIDIGEGFRA